MSLPVGTKLGRYTLDALLGRGGMAEMYAATDDVSGTSVAIKVLHATGSDVVARLLREGRAQARLRHPNVVAVVDALGAPALVMKKVDGGSLAQRLRRGVLVGTELDALALSLMRSEQ